MLDYDPAQDEPVFRILVRDRSKDKALGLLEELEELQAQSEDEHVAPSEVSVGRVDNQDLPAIVEPKAGRKSSLETLDVPAEEVTDLERSDLRSTARIRPPIALTDDSCERATVRATRPKK